MGSVKRAFFFNSTFSWRAFSFSFLAFCASVNSFFLFRGLASFVFVAFLGVVAVFLLGELGELNVNSNCSWDLLILHVHLLGNNATRTSGLFAYR